MVYNLDAGSVEPVPTAGENTRVTAVEDLFECAARRGCRSMRIGNISTLRHRPPPRGRGDIVAQTRTLPPQVPMPQCTSAASARVERTGPGERDARPDRLPPSIDRRTGRISTNGTNATSRRRHDGVRRAPERIRSGRAGAGFGWGGAGTLPRVYSPTARRQWARSEARQRGNPVRNPEGRGWKSATVLLGTYAKWVPDDLTASNAASSCGSGSSGGPRLSLADYVRGQQPPRRRRRVLMLPTVLTPFRRLDTGIVCRHGLKENSPPATSAYGINQRA
jgi:hypothetical protein